MTCHYSTKLSVSSGSHCYGTTWALIFKFILCFLNVGFYISICEQSLRIARYTSSGPSASHKCNRLHHILPTPISSTPVPILFWRSLTFPSYPLTDSKVDRKRDKTSTLALLLNRLIFPLCDNILSTRDRLLKQKQKWWNEKKDLSLNLYKQWRSKVTDALCSRQGFWVLQEQLASLDTVHAPAAKYLTSSAYGYA